MSHDLRAPLRAIDGFSKAVMISDRLDEQGRSYGEVRAAARMSRLIDDLLNLSRIGRSPHEKQSIDISAVALEVIAELHEKDRARAAPSTSPRASPPSPTLG